MICWGVRWVKGTWRVSISHSTMPRLHTSAFSLTRSGSDTSSGAMYGSVPLHMVPTLACRVKRLHTYHIPEIYFEEPAAIGLTVQACSCWFAWPNLYCIPFEVYRRWLLDFCKANVAALPSLPPSFCRHTVPSIYNPYTTNTMGMSQAQCETV